MEELWKLKLSVIMAEIAKCQPAHFKDSGNTVAAMYLPSESIGVIICQAAAMRLELSRKDSEIERLASLEEDD